MSKNRTLTSSFCNGVQGAEEPTGVAFSEPKVARVDRVGLKVECWSKSHATSSCFVRAMTNVHLGEENTFLQQKEYKLKNY